MPTATITSKGQLTLPKSIRERAGAHTGDCLDVSVSKDGTIELRRIDVPLDRLIGRLHRPGRSPATLGEMDEAVREHLASEDERVRSGG